MLPLIILSPLLLEDNHLGSLGVLCNCGLDANQFGTKVGRKAHQQTMTRHCTPEQRRSYQSYIFRTCQQNLGEK